MDGELEVDDGWAADSDSGDPGEEDVDEEDDAGDEVAAAEEEDDADEGVAEAEAAVGAAASLGRETHGEGADGAEEEAAAAMAAPVVHAIDVLAAILISRIRLLSVFGGGLVAQVIVFGEAWRTKLWFFFWSGP